MPQFSLPKRMVMPRAPLLFKRPEMSLEIVRQRHGLLNDKLGMFGLTPVSELKTTIGTYGSIRGHQLFDGLEEARRRTGLSSVSAEGSSENKIFEKKLARELLLVSRPNRTRVIFHGAYYTLKILKNGQLSVSVEHR